MVSRLAADKEANHVEWVKALLQIARSKKSGNELAVSKSDLEHWVDDENNERAKAT